MSEPIDNAAPVALVTGASEGIGRALCLLLAKEGYEVVGVARNQERLQSLVGELGRVRGGDHRFLSLDLSAPADVEKLCAWVRANRCDVFVNNAGFGAYGAFAETDLALLQKMMALNCQSLMALSHAYLNAAREGGALLNVASVAAFLPLPHNAAYSASKAFVHNLSLSLWLEAKKRGIYVGSLCPGYTETEFSKRAGGHPGRAPRKLAASPDDVARSAVRALRCRRSPSIVPGAMNKILVLAARVLPEKWVARLVGAATGRVLSK